MPLPQPPRGDPLDEAVLAWAESSRRLAATLRNAPPPRPQLTVCQAQRCGLAAVALAVAYWWWARTYGCACQWNLAFEVHPLYGRGVLWLTATGVSIAWQLYDRIKVASTPPTRYYGWQRAA